MSPREAVTKERLQVLFEALGREFRRPARLFLSGGEGLVWRGLRGSTLDFDISYEVDAADRDAWVRCLVALVDIFLFDPYAVALSKVERGHARDLEDVKSLLAAGIIVSDQLRHHFEAVLPPYAMRSVKADPARFRRSLESVLNG